jgi:hypothetical protein
LPQFQLTGGSGTAFGVCTVPVPQQRFSVAASTSIYIDVFVGTTSGAATAGGWMMARRVR